MAASDIGADIVVRSASKRIQDLKGRNGTQRVVVLKLAM
jgi:hypothetical protein